MAVKYGFGVIGTGGIFPQHAAALRVLRKRARLIGLADLDSARLRSATDKHFAPHAYDDHRQLLERGDIDVVSIATPPATHERLVIDCLEAGKAVICEKPLAHTLESADRIIQAAGAYPGKLGVVYQARCMPEMRKIDWLRDNGWLGQLRFGHWVRLSRFDEAVEGGTGWWGRWETSGGGVVMTKFIHELDQMIHLFGKPVEVSARMDTLQQQIESEDTFTAMVRFAGGAIVSCSATINAQHLSSTFDVLGEKASVHYPWKVTSRDDEQLRRINQALDEAFGAAPKPAPRSLPGRVASKTARVLGRGRRRATSSSVLHALHFAACLEAIESDSPMPVTPQDARRSLDLCMGIYQSALSGQAMRLPLDASSPVYGGITAETYRQRKVVTV